MDSFDTRMTRRRFGANVGYALASIAFGDGCVVSSAKTAEEGDGRLTARPRSGIANSLRSGPLGLGDGRDGVIQMPSGSPQAQVPLLLFLHGATQSGAVMLRRIGAAADQAGVAVLAPDSRGTTWDAIRGGFGDDVAFLNRALDHVFAH